MKIIKKIFTTFLVLVIVLVPFTYSMTTFASDTPTLLKDINTKKIYTLLQRRSKDNLQWWFPGGYVEFLPSGITKLIGSDGKISKVPDFAKVKKVAIEEYYKNIVKYSSWQKAHKEFFTRDVERH